MRIKHPQDGDERIRSGFLLFPKTIDNETRWLEWTKWLEEWTVVGYHEPSYGWYARMWLDNIDIVD
jgi:hypothetical protein